MTHALLVTCLLLGAGATKVPDVGSKGPFEVGFTSYTIIDTSRPGDDDVYPHRPIPVFVWYPVDRSSITTSSPQAVYPLDVLYGQLPDSVSSDWEKYGIDRAFQEPRPSARRPFPLLVFSPGWGGPPWVHASLGTRLASHGFVVAVPYHFGDWWWWWEPMDGITVSTYNRPLDVSFVLSDLLEKNGTAGQLLAGTIQPEAVAAGGWSLGGYAAMTLAGGDDNVCDTPFGTLGADIGDVVPPGNWCVAAQPDRRIKAIVSHDGSGWILHFRELARIKVPALGLGEEWSMLAQDPDPAWASWHAREHAAWSGHPAYRVDVFNTNHQSFCDLCEANHVLGDLVPDEWPEGLVAFFDELICTGFTPNPVVHGLVSKYTAAFLKTNLSGETGYQNILTPGWALTREKYIEFFETEKRSPGSIAQDWPGNFTYFMHQPGSEQARALKDPRPNRPVQRVLERR